MDEFLDLIGIPEEKILIIKKPTKFEKIIVPDEAIHSQKDYYSEFKIIINRIMQQIIPGQMEKIYLTKSSYNQINCCGEDFFENFYKDRGYEIVAPEQYHVKQILGIIAGAKEIVSTSGTVSHYVMFCRPGTKITVLNRNDNQPLVTQILLNQMMNVEWCFIDVSQSFLMSFSQSDVNCLGNTIYWKKYVQDTFNEYIENETIEKNCYKYLSE